MMSTSPLFMGLRPKLALMMPVAMGSSMPFSQGCTTSVRASVLLTLATWLTGVIEP